MQVGDVAAWIQLFLWAVAVLFAAVKIVQKWQSGGFMHAISLPKSVFFGLLLVTGLMVSSASLYSNYRPRIVTEVKIVEKPVETIVEKEVPQDCPKVSVKVQKPSKGKSATPISGVPAAIQQSNSGGLNVQQATTGQNSPIIDSPITVGSFPKHISSQDMLTLKDYLLRAKARAANVEIRIAADQYSRPSPFVDEFYTAFKGGQWPMKDLGVMEIMGFSAATTKKFRGAVVITKGDPVKYEGEACDIKEPDPLFYIGTVLQALKVQSSLRRDQSQEPNVITIQFEGGFSD